MKQITFTLSFEQNQWICYNNRIQFTGDSLDIIDTQIEAYIKKQFPKQTVNVAMHFDFDRFPIWMRQYMPHYFNRDLTYQVD